MHKYNFCHRDIKLNNVAIFTDNVKLIDFGLSFQYKESLKKYSISGTPGYVPDYISKIMTDENDKTTGIV